ncbi:4-hydroxy-tetrahydrodipicolinate synthase [Ferrimonas gelatinilytica]|uniref:4-hydroxy-tetrahydrodipicolinate synthase n=1 Tax=Ferrimonas gelatinilytica TaxID=1255257 RepID=A0ABP9S039_9GAMM
MFRGSIVALVTPMHQDGQIDFSTLADLVEFHIEQGTDGIVAVGTTGESATLGVPEHIAAVGAVVKAVAGRIPVIAGSGANSTAEAIELTRAMDALGVDGMLTVAPYYNKPSQNGLVAHFKAIAAATDKPQLLYNVPGRTVCDISNETVAELSKVDNIVGLKDATGDLSRVTPLRQACGEEFLLLSGDDPTAMAFMLAGGDGVISVTNNVRPAEFKALCSAALAGDIATARRLDAQLLPLYSALFVEANPIPVKWAMEELGITRETHFRLPLTEPSEHSKTIVRAAIEATQPV